MGQESHEYGMPLPSLSPLLRGHLTHILRGRFVLERFRKHLSPTNSLFPPTSRARAAFRVMWVRMEAQHVSWSGVGVAWGSVPQTLKVMAHMIYCSIFLSL